MWSALRSQSSRALFNSRSQPFSSAAAAGALNNGLLELQEVEKILGDVKADDVKVIPMKDSNKSCEWTDYLVVATGRSSWHVKNIAQALVYQIKEKQRGARRLMLPTVEGQEGGKWIVIDSGSGICIQEDSSQE